MSTAHRVTAFPTTISGFAVLVSWAHLTPLSLLLALSVSLLWLCAAFVIPHLSIAAVMKVGRHG